MLDGHLSDNTSDDEEPKVNNNEQISIANNEIEMVPANVDVTESPREMLPKDLLKSGPREEIVSARDQYKGS